MPGKGRKFFRENTVPSPAFFAHFSLFLAGYAACLTFQSRDKGAPPPSWWAITIMWALCAITYLLASYVPCPPQMTHL